VRHSAPVIELVSCTTGRPVTAVEIGQPGYWRRHLRETVRFADALRTVHGTGCRLFLEIGPHSNLAGMGGRCLPDGAALWLPSLRRDWPERQQVLESLAALYANGVTVDWGGVESGAAQPDRARPRPVSAPTCAWQHRSYRLDHAAPEVPQHAARHVPAQVAMTPEAVWADLIDAGRRQERQGPLDLALPTIPERWAALERLTTAMIAAALRRLGAFGTAGATATASSLTVELGVLPRYERLLARWLDRLAAAGLLRSVAGVHTAGAPLDASDLEPAWAHARRVLADWPFMLDYLRGCGALLADVMTGRASPLDTMFPNGSFDIADALYRDSVLPRYFNAVAGALVQAMVAGSHGERIRVLELGGGTGGTTATLAPLIERAGGSYHFTDVSPLFLARAGERFGNLRCMSFGLLDVDGEPAAQGYEPDSFDVIVAANVLHAARDLPDTLRRVRELLASGGMLLLVEVTNYLAWFDVSTALLEGWDRQGDGLRGEHPMLATAAWHDALQDAGFVDVAAFPDQDGPAEALAQHVLLARAPLAPSDTAPAAGRADEWSRAPGESRVAADVDGRAYPLAARVAAAAPHEREELLVDHVRGHIANLLRMDPDQPIDRRGRLMELGLDSLMAVELRSRLATGLPLTEPLPATLIFDCPTVDAIVARIGSLLDLDGAPAAPRIEAGDDELADLTDEEVEARLLARVEAIEGQLRQPMR
jgi:SAM-dependent methyltransferase